MNWNYLSKYRSEIMGAACLWVMAFHNFLNWPQKLKAIELLFEFGNVGVDVFLLVSGIGLYYSYSNRLAIGNRISTLKDFYWKRLVRLLVPYLFLGLPYYIWYSSGKGIGTFLGNFFQINLPRYGLITSWYVTAAFVFYLLFPIIYYFQQKKFVLKNGIEVERNTITLIMCVLLFVGNAVLQRLEPEIYENCEIALSRIIVFTLGCSIGKEVKEKKCLSMTCEYGGVVFMILYMFMFSSQVELPILWYRMSYVPFGLSAALFFAFFFYRIDKFRKIRRFFTFIGERSLELYLSHVFCRRIWLFYIEGPFLDRWNLASYFCVIVISMTISIVIHPLIKKISNRLL